MKYVFRKGALSGEAAVEYTFDYVRLLDARGREKRKIWFTNMKEINEFAGIRPVDQHGHDFAIQHCRITPRFGRPITFISSYYLEPGPKIVKPIARNQLTEFNKFKLAIRKRACELNPNIETVLGEKQTYRIGFAMIAVGLLLIGLIGSAGWATETTIDATLRGAACGSLIALPLFLLGWWVIRTYRPIRMPIQETLPGCKVTANTTRYREEM